MKVLSNKSASRANSNKPLKRILRQAIFESLEDRRVMAVSITPEFPLNSITQPISLESGLLNQDPHNDLVALGSSGRLTTVLNDGNDQWLPPQELDLGLGPAYGMAAGLLNADPFIDLVVLNSQQANVVLSDGQGGFTLGVTIPVAGSLASATTGPARAFVGLVNEDLFADIVLLDTQLGQVIVAMGRGNGSFSSPIVAAAGLDQPTSVAFGDVIGDERPDIVVGNNLGAIKFFEGQGSATWSPRSDLTIQRTAAIRDLSISDVDADGDLDIAVSASSEAFVLHRDPHPQPNFPIVNGDFSSGLSGWSVESTGQPSTGTAGKVNALGGAAQLIENDSFLTTLKQSFVVPANPQQISLDILSLGLSYEDGSIPDAVELSLLNAQQQSLVPTHSNHSTAWYSAVAQPNAAGPLVRRAAGVTQTGSTVVLDISGLVPGSTATLVIDLVGNPAGKNSTVVVDNIATLPSRVLSSSFTTTTLSGPFSQTGSIKLADVDGDLRSDVVVVDSAAGEILVFNGLADGTFSRSSIPVAPYGTTPVGLAVRPLNKADQIADIAVTLSDSSKLLTPLGSDTVSPQATLISPANNAVVSPALSQIVVQFSEPVLDQGPTGNYSVTNPALYQVYGFGINGVDDGGTGDDVAVAIDSVVYDTLNLTATLSLAGSLPLSDGRYAVVVRGANAGSAIVDLFGNRLADGQDVRAGFAVNGPQSIGNIIFQPTTSVEGQSVTLTAPVLDGTIGGPYSVTIDWGDSSQPTQFSLAAISSPISANHTYSDDGSYTARVTVQDSFGISAEAQSTISVSNVIPTLTISGSSQNNLGQAYVLSLSSSDPGQDTIAGWWIDWGDGSPIEQLTGNPSQATHFFIQPGTFTVRAHAFDEDFQPSTTPVWDTAWVSNSLSVTVTRVIQQNARFFVVDKSDKLTYKYSETGAHLGNPIQHNNSGSPRGIATNGAGNPVWVIDTNKDVDVYDSQTGAILGTWEADGVSSPRGITIHGQDIWLVDASKDQVFLFANAVDRRSGSQSYQSSFELHEDNRHPSDLVTDGSNFWVVDEKEQTMFVYSMTGAFLSSWQLDPRNADPTGVTVRTGYPGLWVVDEKDDTVYYYANRTPSSSAPQVATSTFALAPGNDHPEGIADPAIPINIGDTVTGSVIDPAQTTDYLFSATAGQRVYFDVLFAENTTLNWSLLAPSGAVLFSSQQLVDRDTLSLPESGQYLLQIADVAPTAGVFTFKLHDVPTTTSTPINLGQRVTGGLTTPGQQATYTFIATANQRVTFDAIGGSSTALTWKLTDASGQIVFNSALVDRPNTTLTDGGTYTLTVDGVGDQVSAYEFQLNDLGLNGQSIQIGDTVPYTFTQAGVVEWIFTGNANQKVFVDYFEGMSRDTLTVSLIAPGGSTLYSSTSDRYFFLDSGPVALPATGTYKIRVQSYGTSTATFQLWDVPPPDVNPLVINTFHTGSIESPGREDHWTFTADAGPYYFHVAWLDTPTLEDMEMILLGPNGSVVTGASGFRAHHFDQPITLPTTGNYKMIFKGLTTNSHTPDYTFRLNAIPPDDVQTIGYRQAASGAIEVSGARDQWKFSGTAGDNIFLDFLTVTGGDLEVLLYAPSGQGVYGSTFSRPVGLDRELILPETGVYTLFAKAGYNGGTAHTYEFKIWDIPPEVPQPALLNTTVSGSLVPGQEATYLFQVDEPTEVLFDSIDTNGTNFFNRIAFTLRRPDGSFMLARNLQDQMLTLTPGTYQVVVQKWDINFADTQGTYSFRIQDRATPEMGALDNLGTKFYLGFPRNGREVFGFEDPVLSLTITGSRATSGTVQVPGANFFTSYDVIPGQTTKIVLPYQVELWDSDTITNFSVLVTALDEVAVYGLNQLTYSTDGYTALPVDALGRDYITLGYENTIFYALGGGTFVAMVAAADNTVVTITPPITIGTRTAGVPYTINLNAGQTYNLHTSTPFLADLSGTFVTSTKPIAVYGGNSTSRVPEGFYYADHLIEQMPPTNTWGTEFLSAPLASRFNGDTFRILAQTDNTEVTINGALVTTLARGAFYETILTTASLITANKPILVAQYANSTQFDGVLADPFMMLIPPRQQFQRDYTLSTPATGFPSNFATIILPTSAIASIRHNGSAIPASQFAPIPGSDHSFVRIPISVGSHHFNADVPFGVSIYGFNDHDSYGYFGGMQFAPLQQVSALNLTPASITLPLNSQHTVAAQVVDGSGIGIPGVRVSFNVQGISGSQNVERITNASGLATLIRTSPLSGLDTITAYAAGLTATATVQWQAANPTLTVDSPASGGSLSIGSHVLSGRARAGVPSGSIVEVLVNGLRADALDPSGQFFAAIDVSSGLQSYTVTAIDNLGQSVIEVIEVTGLVDSTNPNDLTSFSDVTSSTSVRYTGTTYHRANRQLSADLQVVNTGDFPLDGPVFVRFDRFTSSSVSLANADADPEIRRVTESPIASLAASGGAELLIDNPNQDRFAAEVTVLARGNRPPRFVSIPAMQIGVGSQYRYTASVVDPDAGLYQQASLSYRLLTGPEGMTVDSSTGQVSWTPAATDVGSHQLSIEASDARGGSAVQSFSLSVLTTLPNRPPVFTSAPNLGAALGVLYRYQATARDLDGDTLGFELSSGPSGATITADGLLEWTSPVNGAHPIAINVSDSRGGSATQQYTLYVGGSGLTLVPTIVSQPPVLAYPNSLYQYSVAATNPFATTLNYSLIDSPAGMTINSGTGIIQWTPTAAQVGSTPIVRIQVSNAEGGLASQSYAVSVVAQPPLTPPRFISSPITFATVNSGYTYNADAVLTSGIGFQPGNNTPDIGLTYALLSGPTGLTINSTTGLIAWSPTSTDLGNHRILISATDTETGLLKAYQQYYLSVRDINTPPTFTSTPISSVEAGTYYRYNAVATDTADAIRYSLVTLPNSPAPAMQIDPIGGSITWQPLLNPGSYPVTVRATDERGATTDQSFTLTVIPDTRAPSVSIILSRSIIYENETIEVQVRATDSIILENSPYINVMPAPALELRVDGVLLPLDAFGRATYTGTAIGIDRFVATATDGSGNVGTDSALLRIVDPSDNTAPQVIIDPTLPGSVITYLTDITGSVISDDLDNYEVAWSLAGANQWTTIHTSTTAVNNGVLATFDPTMLANDIYEIRVTAQDSSGNIATETFEISLEGQAKIGNYRVSFTDLSIPLAGIPITIGRTYDTLDAPYSKDFGYGWTLDVGTPRIRETVRVSASEAAGAGPLVANPFRTGTRVYINAPNGRRVGFSFTPEVTAGLLGAVWTPKFTADPGVDYRLEVPYTTLSQRSDGTFGLYLLGLPYNPDTYTLISKNQMRYTYGQFDDMQLRSISNRNNVRLTFDDIGIHSSIGPEILWTRDAQGRITKITDPDGNDLLYTYTASGDLASFTNQIGETTSMSYLSDPGHYLSSIIDSRNILVLSLAYDEQGRLTGEGDALGNTTRQEYDLANNREVIADRLGNETTLIFDDRGNILEEIDPLGFSIVRTYDSQDNEITVTNKRGFSTQYEYDSRRNVTKITDPLGATTTFAYSLENDLLTVTDALDRVTTSIYDTDGNLIQRTDALGNSVFQSFDSDGRVISRTDARGFVTSFEYSGDGCGCSNSPTKISNPDGTSQEFVYNFYSQVKSAKDELGFITTFDYDNAGQLIEIRSPNGQITTNQYVAGNLTKQSTKIDATTSRVSQVVYDGRNNVVRSSDPNGAETTFLYDASDNLIALTDPVGNTTTFVLDTLQRVSIRRDPLGNETRYFYDDEGNVSKIIDRNERKREFQYDARNRETLETWLNADASIAKTISSTWDLVGNILSVDDLQTNYTWTYDSLNRPLSESNAGSLDLPSLILTNEYDAVGNRTVVGDNYGVRVNSNYGNRNELRSKIWSGSAIDDLKIAFGYNDRLDRTSVTRYSDGAGLNQVGRSAMAYDASGRDTAITHFDAIDQAIAEFDYGYDFANQLVTETNRGETIQYGYDLRGQLTSANRSTYADEFYSYNANGSRLTSHRQSGTSTIGPNNQLLADGQFTYQYDHEGNLILRTKTATGQTTQYEYDHEDRLLRVVEKASDGSILDESTYRYDPLGRRVEKIENGQDTKTLYDGDNAWLDADSSNNVETWYLFGDAQYDENLARYNTDGATWYLADKLGSITTIINIDHTFVASAYFDSFGNQVAATNAGYVDRFAFAAREFDSTGLYHNRARTYNPSTGIFVQQDPISFSAGDLNLYRYAFNVGLNASDPTGNVTLLGYNITTSQILNGGLILGAGGLGCILGDSVGLGKGHYNTWGQFFAQHTVRGGVFALIAFVLNEAEKTSRNKLPAGATTGILAFVAFEVGFVTCSVTGSHKR